MSARIIVAACLLLAMPLPTWAQTPSNVTQARRLVEAKPSVRRQVGLAEILRSRGLKQDALDVLRKAAHDCADSDPLAAEVHALVCWRMLPVVPADRDLWRAHVAKLKTLDPRHPWLPLWERTMQLRTVHIAEPAVPDRFPFALAEQAHLELLQELGWSRLSAAADVIASRSHEPLYALRDLDRALTREADFLKSMQRDADAALLIGERDRYRRAYANAARHLVEKLFALHLLGDTKGRDALLAQAKSLPYLHDRARLASLLERLDDEQAWSLLIEPLLKSELALIANPPDVARLKFQNVADLKIQSRRRTQEGKTTTFEGDVQLQLQGCGIRCEHLTLLIDAPAGWIMTGSGKVHVNGINAYPGGVRAERFIYHADTGSFHFSGDVRLHGLDQLLKLRSCTLTRHGELRDAQSWLNDFQRAFDMAAKLELLPRLARSYAEDELPDEARFLLALQTLRPHLTWHTPYLPPLPRRDRETLRAVRERIGKQDETWPWSEALVGEPWMHGEVPQTTKDAFREGLAAWYRPFQNDPLFKGLKPPDLPGARAEDYFWRIRDPRHPDVERVRKLLAGVKSMEWLPKARRWTQEIERNNTVLTFDIPGAATRDAAHSLLMDVRNADRVSFKLYRVKHPDELLATLAPIGTDFMFRDHGLDFPRRGLRHIEQIAKRVAFDQRASDRAAMKRPVWNADQLVQQWEVRVADLKAIAAEDLRPQWSRRHERYWDEDDDAHYFDDACTQHRPRIDKAYRRAEMLSSWQCDRVVEIPGKALSEAGAYVLIAESNGQVAQAPILVDPLSLTLRRCRDGVFALVSDSDGLKPVERAIVQSPGEAPSAVTDREGGTFLRILATGDRPILAHQEGRYAIGGFGQLFEGIYDAPGDEEQPLQQDRLVRARQLRAAETAFIYGDRHVIVAYTDRPTYRPGQLVQFKLIMRRQETDKSSLPPTFRAEDFDAPTRMVLPELDQPLAYSVLDPKGREVASGTLRLNDFGTAAGRLTLDAETAIGVYALRLRIGGQPRLVPDVFAVKHYRRPNFAVDIAGMPDRAVKPGSLKLSITSRYYFGAPVANARAEVRLLRNSKSIVQAAADLDRHGKAEVELDVPAAHGSAYQVVCNVTDASGRTVTHATPLVVEDSPQANGAALTRLPRFVAASMELKVAISATEIRIAGPDGARNVSANDGHVAVRFTKPGWYRLSAGDDAATIFAYGGERHPLEHAPPEEGHARWVNLSDFPWEADGHLSRWERPAQHLFALFERQQVNVGDKLRLLVYVPGEQRAKLLFTYAGRTVLDFVVRWTDAKAGAYQVVELPITGRCFPNFYLQGRILAVEGGAAWPRFPERELREQKVMEDKDDRDQDPRWCRVDVTDRKRRTDPDSLDVRIKTDRPHYRPGNEVRATIHVSDRAGKPQSAELSLATVDESVFAFGEDGLARLPAFFRAPYEVRRFQPGAWRVSLGHKWSRHAKVQKADRVEAMQQQVLQTVKAQMDLARIDRPEERTVAVPVPRLGGEMPIGQTVALRQHFQETATWLPQVRTDAAGKAEIAFTLPDSLTRYRLTAVALTKSTDVGVGRGALTAALPLAVQVMVPRFAVEKDRIQAVAIIHNTTDKKRDCRFDWHVEGLVVEGTSTGSMPVAANAMDRITLWLRAERIGVAKIRCTVRDGQDTDAEERTLPIEPLGRPAEFAANRMLTLDVLVKPGQLNQHGRINLPAGFVARELIVNVHASDFAQALDGLDDLVHYPYGCIEQTMSRFMPLVMVKHATRHTPIKLQPTIEAKLPEVLQSGLLRVYNLQKPDGSWGWFEKDERNNPMTIYVLYGLARCKSAGVPVDAEALCRGCRYLQGELRGDRLTPELAARAWHVLTLAGHADRAELEALARRILRQPVRWDAFCHLALACRASGLPELGERLWAKVNASQAHDTESLALLLNAQLAFGRPYEECRSTARTLLAMRQGTRWAHTRDTAAAIEAIANMLAYSADRVTVRHVHVRFAGKTILDMRDRAELKKLVYRVRVPALLSEAAATLEVDADSDEPLHVAARATGVQRQDEIQPSGHAIKLERVLETIAGEPLRLPLKVGQAFRVRLRVQLEQRAEYLLLEDRRPASCEFADDQASGDAARRIAHQEFRDDRVCIFFAALGPGTHEIVYHLRAETAGTCTVLPGCAYPMYNDRQRGESGAGKIVVAAP